MTFGIGAFAQTPFASLAGNSYNLQTDESFTINSAILGNTTFLGAAVESFNLSTDDSPVFNFYVAANDSFSLNDDTAGRWNTSAQTSEVITLSDIYYGYWNTSATQSETATFTDSQSTQVTFAVTADENATFTTTQSAQVVFTSTASENLTITSNIAGAQGWAVDQTDTFTLSDTYSSTANFAGVWDDSFSITDEQPGVFNFYVTTAETNDYLDEYVGTQDNPVSRGDTVTLTDSSNSSFDAVGAVAESYTLTDAEAASSDFVGALAEIITIYESLLTRGWITINDGQTPNWANILTSNAGTWTVINNTANTSWINVNDYQGQTKVYVYKITNKINGMLYIGITTRTVHDRWLQHKGCALRGKINHPLYNAMNQYGIDAFEVETVHVGSSLDELHRVEIELIKKHDSYIRNGKGYNMTYGGDSGYPMPPEAIEKSRIARIGQKRTYAQRVAISQARKGKGLLNDHARKHSKEKVALAIELLKQNMKQSQVADMTGLSQPYISRLKSHKRGQTILGA